MKINRTEYPEFFILVQQLDEELINKDQRRGNSFYCQVLIEVTEEDLKWLNETSAKDNLPPDVIGLWLSNTVLHDIEWGTVWSSVAELTKVQRKERQITTTEVYYEAIDKREPMVP